MFRRISLYLLLVVCLLAIAVPQVLAAPGNAAAPDNDLVIAFFADIRALDPHNVSDTLTISATRTMYEALVRFDENQQIVPQLAERYEISDDSLTYTFHLRQGVLFHDGTEFNAAAVEANIERCKDETIRQNRLVKTIANAEYPDPYTVILTLEKPNNTFINKLTMFDFIAPATIAGGEEKILKEPNGTGPYVYKDRVEGDRVTVVPFAEYWDGAPAVDSLTFKTVPEEGSRVAMLQTGEADYIYPMPTTQIQVVEGTDDILIDAKTSNIMRYVTLNVELEQLKDKRVRQAMNYAFNTDAYIKTVFNGYASQVDSCFPDSYQYYSAQPAYDFNLDKAKELMAEAGYPDGFSITIWGDNSTAEIKGMQFVQQQLKQIGINVDVMPMEASTVAEKIQAPRAEAEVNMWYVNWSSSSFDVDGAIRGILHGESIPPGRYNSAYFDNADVNRLLDEALVITDPAELAEKYGEVQQIIWDEAPWIFLGSDQVIAGYKSYLSGVVLSPDGAVDCSKAKFN